MDKNRQNARIVISPLHILYCRRWNHDRLVSLSDLNRKKRFTCSKLSRLFHRRIQIEKYNGKKILTEGKRKDMIWHEIWHKKIKPWKLKALRTGDERIELPPKVLETPIIPFDQSPTLDIPSKPHTLNIYTSYHTFFPNTTIFCKTFVLHFRSSPRPISNSQLHALRHFHLCPIYLVVFKGSYFFRMGYLILRGASRLDAFSVYPFPTWLPGREPGGSTGTPEVSPSQSSRTKDSSSQISYAHAG